MYHTILVPLDGSSLGEYALPLALGIARRSGATVELVHVCSQLGPNVLGSQVDGPDVGEPRIERLQRRGRDYLVQLATTLSTRWEVVIKPTVLTGRPADVLAEHAHAKAADLVVMTTHGYGPLSRAWMGSVADTLMRHLPMPILLARPHTEALDMLEGVHDELFDHILIPLDGSALAEQIVEPAIALGEIARANYTLIQAIEIPVLGYAPAAEAFGLEDRIIEEWRAEAAAYLEHVAEPLRERGLNVHTQVIFGPPALAIIDAATSKGASVIAMSTHGRGGAVRLLLGSIADKVVRGANVPVLLQRPQDEAARGR